MSYIRLITDTLPYGNRLTHWHSMDHTYLSIGTVVLGAVAVYQNKKSHDLNEQLQKLQQASYISMVSATRVMIQTRRVADPKFMNPDMRDINVIDLKDDGFPSIKCYYIDTEFKNDSEYPIVQMLVHPGERTNSNCLLYGMKNLIDQAIYIAKGDSVCFRYIVPCELFEKNQLYNIRLSITFVNVFDYATPSTLYIPDLQNKSHRNKYQYRLSKFTDVRPSPNMTSPRNANQKAT